MNNPRYAHIVPPLAGSGANAATSVSTKPVVMPPTHIASDAGDSASMWRAKFGETFMRAASLVEDFLRGAMLRAMAHAALIRQKTT